MAPRRPNDVGYMIMQPLRNGRRVADRAGHDNRAPQTLGWRWISKASNGVCSVDVHATYALEGDHLNQDIDNSRLERAKFSLYSPRSDFPRRQ